MSDVSICPECKVPEPFGKGHLWLNNGDIVQSANHKIRMGFIECENLDPLFRNIGDIIGVPIDRLLINVTARGVEQYLSKLIPRETREMIQSGELKPDGLIQFIATLCQVVGYGHYEFMDYRLQHDDEDFSRLRILEPFSVPETAGAFAGATASMVGGDHAVSYQEISPGLYEFVSCWTKYPETLREEMRVIDYCHQDGDIEYERCATCGCPRALDGYRWHLDRGLIVNRQTGRRMALLGHELLDFAFKALERELDEILPQVVVEAQRRFVKRGFYAIEDARDEGDFRTQFALRGLGNLREWKMGMQGMSMSIENAACHLMTVGMAQGLFELALDTESFVEWELSEEGILKIEVTPRSSIMIWAT
jgi:hypothetical protein